MNMIFSILFIIKVAGKNGKEISSIFMFQHQPSIDQSILGSVLLLKDVFKEEMVF